MLVFELGLTSVGRSDTRVDLLSLEGDFGVVSGRFNEQIHAWMRVPSSIAIWKGEPVQGLACCVSRSR